MAGYVIAIAGGSASGKSTLAAALQETIAKTGVTVESLSTDRFMRRTDPEAPHFHFTFTGGPMMDCNHPESVDNDAVLRFVHCSTADVLIVEGLMTLAVPSIRETAGLKLFVDLDADIRSIRRMERDIRTGRSNGDPALIMAYYIECAREGHRKYVEPSKAFADLIVRGDADFQSTAIRLSALIHKAKGKGQSLPSGH